MGRRLGLVSGVALVMLFATAAFADGITLKIQVSDRSGDEVYKVQSEEWNPMLEKMTGGRLKTELFTMDAVVPYKETVPAMVAGILDGHITSMEYHSGLNPAFALMGNLVAGYANADQQQSFCFIGPGTELSQKLYDTTFGKGKVHVVGCATYMNEAFVAKVPLRGVADLKGKKLRAPEGLVSEVFRRAGAATVSLPTTEVYTSLEKGVVDGADMASYTNNRTNGLHRVAPYPLFPGIHSVTVHVFAVSQKKWDSLTPDLQATLGVWWHYLYDMKRRYNEIRDLELAAEDRSGKGEKVEIIDWSPEERAKFREIAKGAWVDFANKNALAKEVYDENVKFMKRLGLL